MNGKGSYLRPDDPRVGNFGSFLDEIEDDRMKATLGFISRRLRSGEGEDAEKLVYLIGSLAIMGNMLKRMEAKKK